MNSQLSAVGISATTDASGSLAFGGTRAFSVTTNGVGAGINAVSNRCSKREEYRGLQLHDDARPMSSQTGSQTLMFQNANGSAYVTLMDATTHDNAIASINAQTKSLGIYAVMIPPLTRFPSRAAVSSA